MRSKLTGTRESDAQSTLSSLTAGLLLSIRENPNPRQGTFRGNHHAFEARSRDVLSFGHHPMAECPRCSSRALSHPAISSAWRITAEAGAPSLRPAWRQNVLVRTVY